jgi:formate-dependent nitrite reductase membrane component NrfD
MSHSVNGNEREQRLEEIRAQAQASGRVDSIGIRPSNSPFPVASATTGYYGQPLLKEPQWTPLIPVYFFVGGATGALGVIGALAELVDGNEALARKARWMALAGTGVSTALLIADLGRPSLFLNMLRVIKPQSAMSVGSWVLSGFGASATVSSIADLLERNNDATGLVSFLRVAGKTGCVLFGMPLHNYTGVLIGASAIPVWNNRIRSLPREFGMSGVQAAVSLLELTGETEHAALNAIGITSAAIESWEGFDLLRTHASALSPAKRGLSGALIQVAGVLSGPVPLALRVASLFVRNPRNIRRLAALSGIIGSLLLRYGWLHAGKSSARDWKVPLGIEENSRRTHPGSGPEATQLQGY